MPLIMKTLLSISDMSVDMRQIIDKVSRWGNLYKRFSSTLAYIYNSERFKVFLRNKGNGEVIGRFERQIRVDVNA